MEYEIFIDESGTLADPKDRYIVLAAVTSKNPSALVKLIPKARKRVPPKKKLKRERLISEFKFRNVGDKTKERILNEIKKADVQLFVFIVDKEKRVVKDTPGNYALLVWSLLALCLKKLDRIRRVVIDRHFNQPKKQEEFNREIRQLSEKKLVLVHIDSLTDSRVDLADFVAGAVLREVRDNDSHFKQIIKPKILAEKRVSWRKLKSGKI